MLFLCFQFSAVSGKLFMSFARAGELKADKASGGDCVKK